MTPELRVIASKRLAQPIKFPFTAYSHNHDLLAIVVGPPSTSTSSSTSNFEIQVFRIVSGQIAFTVKRSDLSKSNENPIEVSALAWRPDGTSLGVGWSDGKYGIYDGGSGRQLSLLELPTDGAKEEFALDLVLPVRDAEKEEEEGRGRSSVGVLGFMEHEVPTTKKGRKGGVLTTDDWYENDDGAEQSNSEVVADLPRAIAGLDVTTVLPRLSAIPSHGLVQPRSGANASKFGTQAATDTQFDSQKTSGTSMVQALLACPQDGNVQVLLDDTVKIGSIEIVPKPIAHAAHPHVSTHAVLCNGEGLDDRMRITYIDVPLSTLNGPLLHVIATNTKRIQTLLDYIVQTARCMQFDYTSNVSLPRKYLSFLDDDLQTNHPKDGDAATNLYHLAMTGSFHPQVLEWCVDNINEQSWKRWESSSNNMYTHLQSHLFENLLPALDRMSIALVALRGQAKFHEDSSSFECSPKYFDVLLENIDSIRLVAHRLQLVIQDELRESRAFLRWLKMQHDIGSAGPFTSEAFEIEEREVPNIDIPLVLAHIKNNLQLSKLAIHMDETRPAFEPGETCDRQRFMNAAHIRDMSYERTKEAIAQLDSFTSGQLLKIKDVADPTSLVNMSALVSGLVGRSRDALKHITQWQNRIVFPPTDPPSVMLESWPAEAKVLDMSMEPIDENEYVTRIIAVKSDEILLREVTSPGPQPFTTPSKRHRDYLQRPRNFRVTSDHGEILDAKFEPNTKTMLMALFRPAKEDAVWLLSCNYDDQGSEIWYKFKSEDTFKPERLLIGGRKGKLLCVVFGNRGREWKVLDLDG